MRGPIGGPMRGPIGGPIRGPIGGPIGGPITVRRLPSGRHQVCDQAPGKTSRRHTATVAPPPPGPGGHPAWPTKRKGRFWDRRVAGGGGEKSSFTSCPVPKPNGPNGGPQLVTDPWPRPRSPFPRAPAPLPPPPPSQGALPTPPLRIPRVWKPDLPSDPPQPPSLPCPAPPPRPGLCLKGRGAIGAVPERLQSGHGGCASGWGRRLLAVGNAAGGYGNAFGVESVQWGGGNPPLLQAIPCPLPPNRKSLPALRPHRSAPDVRTHLLIPVLPEHQLTAILTDALTCGVVEDLPGQ